jgi:hypothetical protein
LERGLRCIREGFLVAPNRINVATSRAMDRLVIVGAKRRWPSRGPLSRLVAAFERQEAAGWARSVEAQSLVGGEAAGIKVRGDRRRATKSEPPATAGVEHE